MDTYDSPRIQQLARTVSELKIRRSLRRVALDEGLLLELSSAAAFAAVPSLFDEGSLEKSEEVAVIGTGSALEPVETL